jgi:uncharacterized protein
MLSLERLFSSSNRYLDLLGAGAEEAQQSVRALVALVNTPQDEQALERFTASQRQEKQIREQITTLLCRAFTAPFEREDIEALARALSCITKVTKKFAQRLLLAESRACRDLFRKQANLVEQAASTLFEMIGGLRHGASLSEIEALNSRLQQSEREADKLMTELLGQLYGQHCDALEIIVTRELLEMLEKIIDRHRDAGNIIYRIVLKNS